MPGHEERGVVQQVRPRQRRGGSPWVTLAVLLLIAAAVGLVGLLLWSQIEVRIHSKPMIGPGRFSDATRAMTFEVLQGWEVIHSGSQTQVVRQDGSLPTYDLEIRSMQQMNLVVNWNCPTLANYVAGTVQAISPWDAKIAYIDIPCAQSSMEPAYARVYLTLNDGSGRNAIIVFGPLDGVSWLVVRAQPFTGEFSADLINAMTATVSSARRRS
jgi:hypothetical protein